MNVYTVNQSLQILSPKTRNFVHNYAMSVLQETVNLSDFVRQVMQAKSLTTRDVEKASGKAITHSYVNKIKNGDAKNLSTAILQGLAKGLGVSEEEIFSIVRGKEREPDTKINNTFELLSLKFSGIKSSKNRARAEVLVEMLDRELERMANDPDDED
jgi:transcriptional regulator with XRE-family HTH domain